jgi:hypothetical protein
MNDDEFDDFEFSDEEHEEQNVTGVCGTLKMAWKLAPKLTLAEFLDLALPSALYELTDYEIIESLEEFIHQNQ